MGLPNKHKLIFLACAQDDLGLICFHRLDPNLMFLIKLSEVVFLLKMLLLDFAVWKSFPAYPQESSRVIDLLQ